MTRPTEVVGDAAREISRTFPGISESDALKLLVRVCPMLAHRRQLAAWCLENTVALKSPPSSAPTAVLRLVAAIGDQYPGSVALPRCATCSRRSAIQHSSPLGRICTRCHNRRTRIYGTCDACDLPRTVRHYGGAGALCADCASQKRERATRDLATTLHAELAEVPLGRATEVVAAAKLELAALASLAALSRTRSLARASAEATTTLGLVRLVDLINEEIGRTWAELSCHDCGSRGRLRQVATNLFACSACHRARTAKRCDACGREGSIARRDDLGRTFCDACWLAAKRREESCELCGHNVGLVASTPTGRICRTCKRAMSQTPCERCGQVRACTRAADGVRRCRSCSRGREPCSLCGHVRPVARRLDDGSALCNSCNPNARRACGMCGKWRRADARIDGRPVCRSCVVTDPRVRRPCRSCGKLANPFSKGRCAACVRSSVLEKHFSPSPTLPAAVRDQILAGLAAGRPETFMVSWRRRRTGLEIIRKVVRGEVQLTHVALDAYAGPKTTRAARSFLVGVGALEWRDENLASLERNIQRALRRLTAGADAQLAQQYATWRLLPLARARSTQEKPYPQASRTYATVRFAATVSLLNRIADRGLRTRDFGQLGYDEWCAESPRAAVAAGDFVSWASRKGVWRAKIVPAVDSPGLPWLGSSARVVAQRVNAVRTTDWQSTPDIGLAAALVAQFGVRVSTIVRLRTGDVEYTADECHLKLGRRRLRLEPWIGDLARDAVTACDRDRSRASQLLGLEHDRGDWLFAGVRDGEHMIPATLSKWLRRSGIPPVVARRDARTVLANHGVPAGVLADLLGVGNKTALSWVRAVGASEARYLDYLTPTDPGV